MDAIHQQLHQTIQTLHRKALDADGMLNTLQQGQQGNFSAIFPSESAFTTSSKRFGPYVEEIAKDWQALKDQDEDQVKQALPVLVKKIELALSTIAQFQSSLKAPSNNK